MRNWIPVPWNHRRIQCGRSHRFIIPEGRGKNRRLFRAHETNQPGLLRDEQLEGCLKQGETWGPAPTVVSGLYVSAVPGACIQMCKHSHTVIYTCKDFKIRYCKMVLDQCTAPLTNTGSGCSTFTKAWCTLSLSRQTLKCYFSNAYLSS